MSSLDSWIDLEGLSEVLRELCPEREVRRTTVRHDFDDLAPASRPGLVRDIPPSAEEEPSPANLIVVGRGLRRSKAVVAGYPADEEVERVRSKLERIKAQARKSGLIQRQSGTAGQSVAPAGPPGLGGEPAVPHSGPEQRPPAMTGEGRETPTGSGGDSRGDHAGARAAGRNEDGAAGEGRSAESVARFHPPIGTMGVRLNAFASWASGVIGGGADVFVIDSQGYPLVERGGDPDLLAAALLLCDASLRAVGQLRREGDEAAAVEGALRHGVGMRLGSGSVLTVLPLETVYGMLCLGLHGPSEIPSGLAHQLCEGLLAALGRRTA